MCCDAFRKLFQQDKLGGASLATVRVVSGLVKSLNYNVRPEVTTHTHTHAHKHTHTGPHTLAPPPQVLRSLLALRIQEVQVKKDVDDTAPQKKFMNNKEKRKNLSRMQRKVRSVIDY